MLRSPSIPLPADCFRFFFYNFIFFCDPLGRSLLSFFLAEQIETVLWTKIRFVNWLANGHTAFTQPDHTHIEWSQCVRAKRAMRKPLSLCPKVIAFNNFIGSNNRCRESHGPLFLYTMLHRNSVERTVVDCVVRMVSVWTTRITIMWETDHCSVRLTRFNGKSEAMRTTMKLKRKPNWMLYAQACQWCEQVIFALSLSGKHTCVRIRSLKKGKRLAMCQYSTHTHTHVPWREKIECQTSKFMAWSGGSNTLRNDSDKRTRSKMEINVRAGLSHSCSVRPWS